jgi:hypothetical protein
MSVPIAPKEMRIPLRNAVEKVLGPKGSAIVGDDLADALASKGFTVLRLEDAVLAQANGLEYRYDDGSEVWQVTTKNAALTEDGTYHLVPMDTGEDQ